jgi:predicted dithiol-disulfide oxidoreductase (DUF899 family)
MIMTTSTHSTPKVASREEWLAARKALFAKEKAMTHELDALRAERRARRRPDSCFRPRRRPFGRSP